MLPLDLSCPARAATYIFTTIDVPGATSTPASGINDPGQIVGTYIDTSSNGHGFLDDAAGFATIDVPGAAATFATGINDLGQIVGSYPPRIGPGLSGKPRLSGYRRQFHDH